MFLCDFRYEDILMVVMGYESGSLYVRLEK